MFLRCFFIGNSSSFDGSAAAKIRKCNVFLLQILLPQKKCRKIVAELTGPIPFECL